ncbi:MAG TPA: NRDE family protein [Steroidobacteraceae bacterium]|nr:NRDE family protein [Steroidobacteraceae bacterium]
MCLLMLAWQAHPRYALVVAANRDEFHERPAAPLAKWPPPAEIIAGRDLQAHGTWLGIDRERRFGVVTNFRELQPAQAGAPSRGGLIPDYLGAHTHAGQLPPGEFLAALEPRAPQYSGFNLLLSDADSLWYGSNRATPFARRLPPGVYGLSNELLDTPWPKLQRVRAGFEAWVREPPPASPAKLFGLLADRTPAGEPAPAHTGGLPAEWARVLAAPFVLHPRYGTRSSTVVLLEPDGRLFVAEHRFDAAGRPAGETEVHLNPGEWP